MFKWLVPAHVRIVDFALVRTAKVYREDVPKCVLERIADL